MKALQFIWDVIGRVVTIAIMLVMIYFFLFHTGCLRDINKLKYKLLPQKEIETIYYDKAWARGGK